MNFDGTAVGLAIAKIAELAKSLKEQHTDRKCLQIILGFEKANLDAKEKAVALYAENMDLKGSASHQLAEQKSELEAKHSHEVNEIRHNHSLEIARRDSEIQELKAKISHAAPIGLDDDCAQILVAVANADDITPSDVLQWLGIQRVRGEYCFDRLLEGDLVRKGAFSDVDRGPCVFLTPAGRDYMAANGLLDAKPKTPQPRRIA